MSLKEYLKDIDAIEDDYEFMISEYNAVHEYCEKQGYMISDEDLQEIESRGLGCAFDIWKKESEEENYV